MAQSPAQDYFCLKVYDSDQQGWRYEQRFDKLFEALEILCRHLDVESGARVEDDPLDGGADGERLYCHKCHAEIPKSREVALALRRVGHPLKVKFLLSDQTRYSVERLCRVVCDAIERELRESNYAAGKGTRHRMAITFLRKNAESYLEAGEDTQKAAEGLLLFCIALRNCRFHAYEGTSGETIGHKELLEPFCDGFKEVLLAIAAGVFAMSPEELQDAINAGGARRRQGLELQYDFKRHRFEITSIPRSFPRGRVQTPFEPFIQISEREDGLWTIKSPRGGPPGRPLVVIPADNWGQTVARKLTGGRAHIGSVIVELMGDDAIFWFRPDLAPQSVTPRVDQASGLRVWIKEEELDEAAGASRRPVIVGLSVPRRRLIKPRGETAFWVRYDDIKG